MNEFLSKGFVMRYNPITESYVVKSLHEATEKVPFEPAPNAPKPAVPNLAEPKPAAPLPQEDIAPVNPNNELIPVEPQEPPTNESPIEQPSFRPPVLPPRPPRPPQPPRPPVPPPRPEPPCCRPPRPPMPPTRPTGAVVIRTARLLYFELDELENIYRRLGNMNKTYQNEFNDMVAETQIMKIAMLNIYRTLSGNSFPLFGRPTKPNISTTNFCVAVLDTINYQQNIINRALYFQRLVNVSDIDRQMIIMIATLNSQQTRLNRILSECKER